MDIKKQLEIIKRGTVEIISEEELVRKLQESQEQKRPLRIKAGFDPTAADLHLGHTVLLRKLRQFQDMGHKVVFLIGDFTGCIGDPSGRNEARKQLSKEEVSKNAITYKKQIAKILDTDKIETVFNSKWFTHMPIFDILQLASHATVAQMTARADFKKRLLAGEDISVLEFMYPLLQGYDSVKVKADIELGGTDQIFNLLVGRDIQKDYGQAPQVVIIMPLLEGTDGVQKMSKSYGNYIGINEPPSEIFGKVMSISDDLMIKYYELLTDENLDAVKNMHPKEAKMKLAQIITAQYHSAQDALKARDEFERVFSSRAIPEDLPVCNLTAPADIISIIIDKGLSKSKNDARRLIQHGAVVFNESKITDDKFIIDKSGILKIGSRRFLKIEYAA